jgi:hypothetical protein
LASSADIALSPRTNTGTDASIMESCFMLILLFHS